MTHSPGELRCVNRLNVRTHHCSFAIGQIKELYEGEWMYVTETEEGLYYDMIPPSHPFHPDNLGRRDNSVIKPSRLNNNKNNWHLTVPIKIVRKRGWDLNRPILSIFCIAPKKRYFVRIATSDEIRNFARRDNNIRSGLVLDRTWAMAFTPSEREEIDLHSKDYLQVEMNFRDGDFIKIHKWVKGEKKYPLLSDIPGATKRFGACDYDNNAVYFFSVNYQSRFFLPKQFVLSNGIEPGDILSVTHKDGEILIEGDKKICSVCGKEFRGRDTKMRNGHFCGHCNTYIPDVTEAVGKYGSISEATAAVQTTARKALEEIEAKLSKAIAKSMKTKENKNG